MEPKMIPLNEIKIDPLAQELVRSEQSRPYSLLNCLGLCLLLSQEDLEAPQVVAINVTQIGLATGLAEEFQSERVALHGVLAPILLSRLPGREVFSDRSIKCFRPCGFTVHRLELARWRIGTPWKNRSPQLGFTFFESVESNVWIVANCLRVTSVSEVVFALWVMSKTIALGVGSVERLQATA
jgi:hypothetical protein